MNRIYITRPIKALIEDTKELTTYLTRDEVRDIKNGEFKGYVPNKLKRNLDILQEETGVEWDILREWID